MNHPGCKVLPLLWKDLYWQAARRLPVAEAWNPYRTKVSTTLGY